MPTRKQVNPLGIGKSKEQAKKEVDKQFEQEEDMKARDLNKIDIYE